MPRGFGAAADRSAGRAAGTRVTVVPSPGAALDSEAPAVRVDDAIDDGEAEARAARAAS